MATERLRVILELEASQYRREARQASSATKEIGSSAEQTSTRTGRLKNSFRDLGTTAKLAVGAAAAGAVIGFFKNSVNAATELGESVNAVEKIFGEASGRILKFGEISAQVVGLSSAEFNSLAVNSGALLRNFGFSADEAAGEAIKLTQRASDLASVFNTDVGDALGAIQAGLRGETEPLRRFGVSLDDATVRAKAVELGLAETTAEVDKNGKATAALALIYEQTNSAAGDFIQTSDSLANAQRIQAATAENAAARFGKALEGPLATAQDFGATVLDSFSALGLFGEANAVVAQNSLRVQEAIEGITAAAQTGGDPLTALADGLLHIAANGDLTADTFFALAAGAGLGEEQFEDFNRVIQEQGEALGLPPELMEELADAIVGTGDAAGDAEGDMDGLAGAQDDAAKSAEELREEQRALQTAFLEAANPIFAAQGALDRYADAQANLADLQEDGSASAEEIAAAQLDVAAAALEAEGALTDLANGDIQGGIGTIAEALQISDAEARDLLETLGILNGTEVTSTVTTRYRTSGAPPSRLPSGGSRFQHGGTLRAGQLGLVGEVGPELIRPEADVRVIPNSEITTGGLGGGTTLNENVNITFQDSRLRDDPLDAVRVALATRRLSQTIGV